VTFGSTAPPSASADDVVFLGLDNEEHPTLGGIYRAPLASKPPLETLVAERSGPWRGRGHELPPDRRSAVLRWPVPGLLGRLGQRDARHPADLPTDGQADVVAYCQATYPQGYATQVPVHQGFFVLDTQSRQLYAAAKTGATYQDFLYWTFSASRRARGMPMRRIRSRRAGARPPSSRPSTSPAPRPRSPSRAGWPAADDRRPVPDDRARQEPQHQHAGGHHHPARQIDPAAPAGALVSALGLEREALRGHGWPSPPACSTR
jgi:hypothetical protein